MRAFIQPSTHTYILYAKTCIYAHVQHTFMRTCAYTYLYRYKPTYLSTYLAICMHTDRQEDRYTYLRTCMHAYIYTYIRRYVYVFEITSIKVDEVCFHIMFDREQVEQPFSKFLPQDKVTVRFNTLLCLIGNHRLRHCVERHAERPASGGEWDCLQPHWPCVEFRTYGPPDYPHLQHQHHSQQRHQ